MRLLPLKKPKNEFDVDEVVVVAVGVVISATGVVIIELSVSTSVMAVLIDETTDVERSRPFLFIFKKYLIN